MCLHTALTQEAHFQMSSVCKINVNQLREEKSKGSLAPSAANTAQIRQGVGWNRRRKNPSSISEKAQTHMRWAQEAGELVLSRRAAGESVLLMGCQAARLALIMSAHTVQWQMQGNHFHTNLEKFSDRESKVSSMRSLNPFAWPWCWIYGQQVTTSGPLMFDCHELGVGFLLQKGQTLSDGDCTTAHKIQRKHLSSLLIDEWKGCRGSVLSPHHTHQLFREEWWAIRHHLVL